MHKAKRAVLFLLGILVSRNVVGNSAPDTIRDCGYIFYGDYEPREPSSLRGFPKRIRARVAEHLRARLGDAYSRLQYSGGQIVDLKKLYNVEPDAREYQWSIPTYLLHFTIKFGSDPDEQYCASVSFDTDGEVIEEIALPRTAEDPAKLGIISKARALEIAKEYEVPIAKASTDLAYAPSCDCLEWLVGFTSESNGFGSSRRKILHLNAIDPRRYRWTEEVVEF